MFGTEFRACAVFVCITILFIGCNPKMSETERIRHEAEKSRVKAVPINGVVLVDGKPQENILVSVYKEGQAKPLSPNVHVAASPDGRFSFSTYANGDGLVPGNYLLTFEWHKIRLRSSKTLFEGPDKLNGRYSNPARSDFKLQVVENQAQQEIEFQLKSK